ncbi:MAG: transglutaminase domain-containing protein [Haloarculaceae archaeon]
MSSGPRREPASAGTRTPWLDRATGWLWSSRALALAGIAGLLFSFLSILYGVVSVTGGEGPFLALVAGTALVAAPVSRWLRVRTVAWLALFLLVGGLTVYLLSLPRTPTPGPLVASVLELLTGRSVYRIRQTELWVLAVTPGPVFLTVYLALREWYASAVTAGGLVLGFLVLTGDAGATVALLGVVAGVAAIGFGDFARTTDAATAGNGDRGASAGGGEGSGEGVDRGRRTLLMELAGMVVVSQTVNLFPTGEATPLSLTGGGERTVEASLLTADSRLEVLGSISLSPEVRFTVQTPVTTYWRVGSYDFYTGDGWVRDGDSRPYSRRLSSPPGPTATVTQEFTVESEMSVMPAAWRPVSVGDSTAPRTRVTEAGGLQPATAFTDGDTYTVTSEVPRPDAARLASAGTDYPERVRQRYTQLPADTPDRVAERTARLAAEAENPYEVARTVEAWLEDNREYSLDVDRPDGNIADSFLFEMEEGYCTYYATTMVTMLRTQGIPARFTVGYTPGETSGRNRRVVRGFDSHAWVEVYFPDTGWVRFDPTPATPRREAERQRLSRARANEEEDVEPDRTPTPTTTTPDGTNDTGGGTVSTPTVTVDVDVGDLQPETPTPEGGGGGFELPDPPSREEVLLGLVVVGGAAAGLRQAGLSRRMSLWARDRFGGDDDPEATIERAFARLELTLEEEHRARKPGETVRAYLADVDAGPRARRLAAIRERARYRGEATEGLAAEARDLLADIRQGPETADGDADGEDGATGGETPVSGS